MRVNGQLIPVFLIHIVHGVVTILFPVNSKSIFQYNLCLTHMHLHPGWFMSLTRRLNMSDVFSSMMQTCTSGYRVFNQCYNHGFQPVL